MARTRRYCSLQYQTASIQTMARRTGLGNAVDSEVQETTHENTLTCCAMRASVRSETNPWSVLRNKALAALVVRVAIC